VIFPKRSFAVALLAVSLLGARSPAQVAHASNRTPHSASAANCKAGSYEFSGVVKKGATFSEPFGGFVFSLVALQYGWMVDISQGELHYLANFTPPRHIVPSPIEIEGWQFRNQANSGPNMGDVNAPDQHREFFFSPKFGTCMREPENVSPADFEAATRDGTGVMEITDLTLGNLKPGEKADIEVLKFKVRLTVANSACEPCQATANPKP
jgi:hypothetical protein